MTAKELKKLHVISCTLEGKLTVAEASKALDLTERRIKQLKKEVKEHGVESVIHGNRGRKPAHAIDSKLAQRIVELKNSFNYQEANILHFQELLEEYKKIKICTGDGSFCYFQSKKNRPKSLEKYIPKIPIVNKCNK